jgi:hypothetical protein
MKIHALPPFPPIPPVTPQKAPPSTMELEQRAQELIAAAQQQRAWRNKPNNVRRKLQHLDEDPDADRDEQARRSDPDTVDVLA